MKVRNMENSKGNVVKNQFIITGDNKVTFQSYDSTIAIWNTDTKVLELFTDWDYSRTTLRFFKQFINEEIYCSFEYETKAKWDKLLNTLVEDGTVKLMY